MGWSMKGILTSALGSLGGAAEDWAKRGIAEDAKIRDEERAAERLRERDEFQEAALDRRADKAATRQEEADFKKRDKDATTVGVLEWEATKAEDGPKLTPGTVKFHDWMQSKLSASGEENLAKNQASMSNLLRDDQRSERQLEGSLANAGAARAQAAASLAATREDRAAQLELKRDELKGRQEKEFNADLLNLGTLKYTDKASGENMSDPRAYNVLRAADGKLEKDFNMTDRQERLSTMVDIAADARDYYSSMRNTKKPVSWEMAMRQSYDTWEKAHRTKK